MKLLVLSCAEQELGEVVDYYNGQCPGLGYEFAARARRCLTDRFPYGLLYQVRSDCILVGAIMHLRRDPQAWLDRVGDAFGE